MNGLDTNVLLRLFISDDVDQQKRAIECVKGLRSSGPVVVNSIVLSEFSRVMARSFRKPRSIIADLIDQILAADDLQFMFAQAAARAVAAYRVGKADFADYFIAEINIELGCLTTFTFDKTAARNPAFTEVP